MGRVVAVYCLGNRKAKRVDTMRAANTLRKIKDLSAHSNSAMVNRERAEFASS
jgi:hypothetical protein